MNSKEKIAWACATARRGIQKGHIDASHIDLIEWTERCLDEFSAEEIENALKHLDINLDRFNIRIKPKSEAEAPDA